MYCQKCEKNPATLYYKQTVNGVTKEIALCSECANQKEMKEISSLFAAQSSPFDLGLNHFFGSLFGATQEKPNVCPLCGSDFNSLMQNGKIGCAQCYTTFGEELSNTIGSIHGNVNHIGRVPKKWRAKREKGNRLVELKAQLQEAIQKQEFENAAKLRDEIKTIEEQQ